MLFVILLTHLPHPASSLSRLSVIADVYRHFLFAHGLTRLDKRTNDGKGSLGRRERGPQVAVRRAEESDSRAGAPSQRCEGRSATAVRPAAAGCCHAMCREYQPRRGFASILPQRNRPNSARHSSHLSFLKNCCYDTWYVPSRTALRFASAGRKSFRDSRRGLLSGHRQ